MKKQIAIIGTGPSALMLASTLNEKYFDITMYERKAAPARKFLVAGDGGFNLTHSEDKASFIQRYTPASFFENAISSFSNTDLINWFQTIGIPTYTGSSKRVFPEKGIKPIDVLNAILKKLKEKKIIIETQQEWKGWNEKNELQFISNDKYCYTQPDIVVFALGGASWSITGSDGKWTNYLSEKRIDIIPFQASNCAYAVQWPNDFLKAAEGKALKNIAVTCDGKEKKGELVITKSGIEGGAIYALSPEIRKQLSENKTAVVFIDLKPQLTKSEIIERLNFTKGNISITKNLINKINLDVVQVALLKNLLSKEEYTDKQILAEKIKKLSVTIVGLAPIDEAISTVGGISLNEIDENFQLTKLSNHYAIGEMLNWDAPTGGYLLQACFSMGYKLGTHLNKKCSVASSA